MLQHNYIRELKNYIEVQNDEGYVQVIKNLSNFHFKLNLNTQWFEVGGQNLRKFYYTVLVYF